MTPIHDCFEDVLQQWPLFFVVDCCLPSDGSHWPAITAEYQKKKMHIVLARYCYRKSSICPSVCPLWYPGCICWVSSKVVRLPAYFRVFAPPLLLCPKQGKLYLVAYPNQVSGSAILVRSGHGSVCKTRCLTRFWVLTCAFIIALFLQSSTISAN